MAGRTAAPLELTTAQRQELTALIRAHSTPQKLAERARIIILAADGVGVGETAQRLGIWRKTASTWRRRWQDADATKSTAERLSDAPRSGAPSKFMPEQICAKTEADVNKTAVQTRRSDPFYNLRLKRFAPASAQMFPI